ncbi:hypothetical protein B0H10DRAFT_1961604 [Mycena sp. CBHHK59/15]|nr:hypothetical protein B0H10DRAFT_1961604 [Mycena sp. CBHHK59/15]
MTSLTGNKIQSFFKKGLRHGGTAKGTTHHKSLWSISIGNYGEEGGVFTVTGWHPMEDDQVPGFIGVELGHVVWLGADEGHDGRPDLKFLVDQVPGSTVFWSSMYYEVPTPCSIDTRNLSPWEGSFEGVENLNIMREVGTGCLEAALAAAGGAATCLVLLCWAVLSDGEAGRGSSLFAILAAFTYVAGMGGEGMGAWEGKEWEHGWRSGKKWWGWWKWWLCGQWCRAGMQVWLELSQVEI